MIDLSRDANVTGGDPSCGSCEYCVHEAANLGVMIPDDVQYGSDGGTICLQTGMITGSIGTGHAPSTLSRSAVGYRSADHENSSRKVHGILKNHKKAPNSNPGTMDANESADQILASNNFLASNNYSASNNFSASDNCTKPPILICIIIVSVYFLIGAYILKYSFNKSWTLLESAVFMFDCLSTTGSGIELSSKYGIFKDANLSWRPIIFITSFLLIGYSLISMTLISVIKIGAFNRIKSFGQTLQSCSCLTSKKKIDDGRRRSDEDDFDDGV